MKKQISEFAKSLGFDLVGFSPAKIEEKYLTAFEDWLDRGLEADMAYMRKIEERRDLTRILPGAKSVVVLATNYYHEQAPLPRGHGRIARYAYGRDYHKVIGKRLRELEKFILTLAPGTKTKASGTPTPAPTTAAAPNPPLTATITTTSTASSSAARTTNPSVQTKAYVDTGPVLERALAEQAGLGRIGKNSCLITPEFGSWVLLSEIITTLDLSSSGTNTTTTPPSHTSTTFQALATPNHFTRWQQGAPANVCGNCTRCIDACPTGAIIAPGVIDSRLCISYLTIENRDKIPPALAAKIRKAKTLFGCDICQAVCPHNEARSKPFTQPKIAGDSQNLKRLQKIRTDSEFLQQFAGSPLMRAKKSGLLRNSKALTHR